MHGDDHANIGNVYRGNVNQKILKFMKLTSRAPSWFWDNFQKDVVKALKSILKAKL